jgi:hypothetical protein
MIVVGYDGGEARRNNKATKHKLKILISTSVRQSLNLPMLRLSSFCLGLFKGDCANIRLIWVGFYVWNSATE